LKYKLELADQSGTEETILTAENLGEAVVLARKWARALYAHVETDVGETVCLTVQGLAVTGEPTTGFADYWTGRIDVGSPDEAYVAADWEATLEVEGGLVENPGVWCLGGTKMTFATHHIRDSAYRRKETSELGADNRVWYWHTTDGVDVEYPTARELFEAHGDLVESADE